MVDITADIVEWAWVEWEWECAEWEWAWGAALGMVALACLGEALEALVGGLPPPLRPQQVEELVLGEHAVAKFSDSMQCKGRRQRPNGRE